MRRDRISILVIGVGGNVSQGILKALALSNLNIRIIGACINPMSAGLYTVDKSCICPMANSPLFIKWLIKVCKAEKIRAILSGVEEVLNALAQYSREIKQETGAVCIVSSPSRLSISKDKLLTCQWLKRNNFNYPCYADSKNKNAISKLIKSCGYPLFAKPRKGKGSTGIMVIHNFSDLKYVTSLKDYVIQEYLGDDDSEYTAGCFCDNQGKVKGTIIMRRELSCGVTHRAELGDYPLIQQEVINICETFKPMGPCNFQLRIDHNRPICFEINARFSGTTPIRARLGFNEVEAALNHYVLGKPLNDLPKVTKGVVLRYWNEMYVDPDATNILREAGVLNEPQKFNVLLEDYGMRRATK